jgi:electron transfer flavoprotein alpha subunit
MGDRSGVLFLAERRGQSLTRTTAELATAASALASKLGEDVCALLAGSDLGDGPEALAGMGVKKVYVVDDTTFDVYQSEPYLALAAKKWGEIWPLGWLPNSMSPGFPTAWRSTSTAGSSGLLAPSSAARPTDCSP